MENEKTKAIRRIVMGIEELAGRDTIAMALDDASATRTVPGPANKRMNLLASANLPPVLKDLLAGLGLELGSEEAAGAAVELIKWIFKPTAYRDFIRTKNKEQTDRVQVPEDEPDVNAPNVTAEIQECKCKEGAPGWIQVTFKITATSGADNDDVTRVNISLPSTDCNGYRYRGLPHVFGTEEERQTHLRTIDIKCSDIILRRENPPDGFLWVELEVVDDDGNSRTTWMKVSSPSLDKCVADCCQRGN